MHDMPSDMQGPAFETEALSGPCSCVVQGGRALKLHVQQQTDGWHLQCVGGWRGRGALVLSMPSSVRNPACDDVFCIAV